MNPNSNCFELKLVGNVKLIIPNHSKKISSNPDEGDIARIYIEFDDAVFPDGETTRKKDQKMYQNFKEHPERTIFKSFSPLKKNKPLRIPLCMGELARITQGDIKEDNEIH